MRSAFYLFNISLVILLSGCGVSDDRIEDSTFAIIPAPRSIVEHKGFFSFSKKSRIILSPVNDRTLLAASFLADLIRDPSGEKLTIVEGEKAVRGSVFMTIDPSVTHREGYILTVSPKAITVKAGTAAGLFYAVQTLRQLLPPGVEKHMMEDGSLLSVPACEIKDEPRFEYRGMHLDVGRHMFPVEEIKRYIDMIAMHKMNTFHWHLTEDQGWRIEINKYPNLTATGSYRKETLLGHSRERPYQYDGQPYGGFYSRQEVKDIVSYAAERFVTVIPEIEMPGHALAALASYPELSCTGGPFEVFTRWGVVPDVFCAGKEETFTFLEDVLTEVMDLFPGEYIHIGGDECPKTRWESCPLCQRRISEEGLKDEDELQSYFISRIEKFVISKGRRIIGWDEILEGGLAPDATVMSWRGIKGGIEAARQRHNVIMTPTSHMYLDYYQCEPEGQPLAIGGYLPLEKVYSFEPVPEELSEEEQSFILGLQGNVWTEYISDTQQLEYMVFPRMTAIAETAWTPAMKKDFEDFLSRLEVMKERYDALEINYFSGEYRNVRDY